MKLTEQQEKLLAFVTKKHGDQKRKYTGEPYVNHCVKVAKIVSEYEDGCVEIALCHDLFEDTDCDFTMLYSEMRHLDYTRDFAYKTCSFVLELTDVFTHEDYPNLNRSKRKQNEAKRLGKISYKAQCVKYADLIDNTSSIVEHDEDFAKVYLAEKDYILSLMTEGDLVLKVECIASLMRAKKRIGYTSAPTDNFWS